MPRGWTVGRWLQLRSWALQKLHIRFKLLLWSIAPANVVSWTKVMFNWSKNHTQWLQSREITTDSSCCRMRSKSVSPSPFWPEVCALLAWSCPSMDIWRRADQQKLRMVKTEGLERWETMGSMNFYGLFVFFTLHNIIRIQYLLNFLIVSDCFIGKKGTQESSLLCGWADGLIGTEYPQQLKNRRNRHKQTHPWGFARLHSRQLMSLHWLPTHPRRWKLKQIYGKII